MNEIAHGSIGLDLNDGEVLAGLAKVDAEFQRTLARIEHSKATAKVDADLAPLRDDLANAKRQLREMEGRAAHVSLDVRKGKWDKKLAQARAEVKRLDGLVAEVELKVKGTEKVIAAERAIQAANDKRIAAAEQALKRQQAAEERAARQRIQTVERVARTQASLERQKNREIAAAEREAYRMESERARVHRYASQGLDQDVAKVLKLQREYAKLTDQLERIAKQRPIGKEARAKVELDAASVYAKMEAIKSTLNAMGAHPPVDIQVDIDRKQAVKNWIEGVANKFAKLGTATVRVGPFTTTIRGMISALSILGPTITDVLGAAGALIGTLGAGIAGAATIGAGAVTGLGGAFLGLMFSTRNTRQEIKNARTAINAYQKAVEKYGASSDKAKAKQQEMNNTLKGISPLAREAALGTEKFFSTWDKHTGPTQQALGRIAKSGFAALNAITPMWARRTNEMSKTLADNLSKGFNFLGRGRGRGMLDSIFGDFNRSLPQLFHGLGAFGQSFLRIAVEGAHNIGILTGGIDSLGQKLLSFTSKDSFGQTVHGWVMQARDLMRFFGALSRVMIHFFGDGAKAGNNLVKSMTSALNRWDTFLTSVEGRNKLGTAFDRAAHGAQQLWHALAPLVGSFLMWANNLSPFVSGVLQGIGYVSRLVAAVTKLTGLGGPLTALGVTLGSLWAVGKIGTFVSMLARIPGIIREISAAGSLGGAFKALGNLKLSALGGGAGIVEAGGEAAAEIRAAIISGGAVAAGEMRAAIATGGAAAGAEGAAGGLLGGAKKLILPAGALAGESAAAGEAAVAVGGLTVATGGLVALGVAAAAGLIYLATTIKGAKSEVDKLKDSIKSNSKSISADNAVVLGRANAQTKAAHAEKQAAESAKALREELKQATPGTMRYRDLQLKLYDATQRRNEQSKETLSAAREQKQAARDEINDLNKQIDLVKKRTTAEVQAANKKNLPYGRNRATPFQLAQADSEANKIAAQGASELAALQARVAAALNTRAAATLNVARAQHNLSALEGRSAQQAGALARTHPAMAQSIALKYTAPKDVGNVSAAARRALGQGVSIKTVMHIIADSSNAEAALRRLRTIEVNKKMVRVGIAGHDGVLSKLNEIDRKAIRRKIARIIQQGGEPTLGMITRIINRQIRDKSFAVRAQVAQATGAILAVQNLMASLHDKTLSVNIVQHAVSLGNKKASGRGPGGTERALIGEGGGPEHYIDPQKGLAFKTNGPMMMDLSPSAYVVPTEPRYANRGRELLMSAANDLGMQMYAGGRGNKHKKKPAPYKKLPMMRNGSLRTDYFASHQNSTRDAVNADVTKRNQSHSTWGKAKEDLTSAEKRLHDAKTPSAKKKAHEAITKAKKRVKEAHDDYVRYNKAYPGLLKAAHKAEDEYNRYAGDQNAIQSLGTEMNTTAAQYNRTGDPALLKHWNDLKGSRSDKLGDLVDLITMVKHRNKDPKWDSELGNQLSTALNDQDTADAEEAPSLTLEGFIGALGKTDALTALNTAFSQAQVDTPNDVTDDTAAAGNLVKFYEDIYGAAKGTGNQGLIGEAANALKGARDTLAGLAGTGSDTNQQAVNDQLATNLYNVQRQNAANEAYIKTALGPGDIGAGTAGGVAAGGTVININTLHPGDPATLRAIGDAATSGMGYQPAVSSTVLRTGM